MLHSVSSKEIDNCLVIFLGVVDPQVGMTALSKPYQFLVLRNAGIKQLAALFGDGEDILLTVQEQHPAIGTNLTDGGNGFGLIYIGAGMAPNLHHSQLQHREEKPLLRPESGRSQKIWAS